MFNGLIIVPIIRYLVHGGLDLICANNAIEEKTSVTLRCAFNIIIRIPCCRADSPVIKTVMAVMKTTLLYLVENLTIKVGFGQFLLAITPCKVPTKAN